MEKENPDLTDTPNNNERERKKNPHNSKQKIYEIRISIRKILTLFTFLEHYSCHLSCVKLYSITMA